MSDDWWWEDKLDEAQDRSAKYENALRLIVESENNTLSYPEDLYYRVLKIAKEALQDD